MESDGMSVVTEQNDDPEPLPSPLRTGRGVKPLPYNPDSMYASTQGYHGSLTNEQRKVRREFEALIDERGLDISLSKHPREHLHPFLLRWLRARKFDMAAAYKMLEGDVGWRREMGIRELMKQHPREILGCDPGDAVKELAIVLQGNDKEGRPIFFQNAKDWWVDRLIKKTTQPQYMRYHLWKQEVAAELAVRQSEKTGQHIDTFCVVIDLKNMSMSQITRAFYKLITAIAKMDSDHFPERLGPLYIINAPRMFTFVWGGIKPALDERTRNKLKLIGTNYEEELLGIIDSDQLPPEYGGTGEPLAMDDHLLLHSVEEIMDILDKQEIAKVKQAAQERRDAHNRRLAEQGLPPARSLSWEGREGEGGGSGVNAVAAGHPEEEDDDIFHDTQEIELQHFQSVVDEHAHQWHAEHSIRAQEELIAAGISSPEGRRRDSLDYDTDFEGNQRSSKQMQKFWWPCCCCPVPSCITSSRFVRWIDSVELQGFQTGLRRCSIVLFVFGALVLGFGAYARVSFTWKGDLISWGMWTATMTMFLGVFLVCLSFLGYYGQRQRSSGLISMYCACLGFIALTCLVFGVACFVIKERAQSVRHPLHLLSYHSHHSQPVLRHSHSSHLLISLSPPPPYSRPFLLSSPSLLSPLPALAHPPPALAPLRRWWSNRGTFYPPSYQRVWRWTPSYTKR
jgi:hypothetical protein